MGEAVIKKVNKCIVYVDISSGAKYISLLVSAKSGLIDNVSALEEERIMNSDRFRAPFTSPGYVTRILISLATLNPKKNKIISTRVNRRQRLDKDNLQYSPISCLPENQKQVSLALNPLQRESIRKYLEENFPKIMERSSTEMREFFSKSGRGWRANWPW